MPATSTTSHNQRSRFGHARFGGGSGVLIALSTATGALIASGLGAAVAVSVGQGRPGAAFGLTVALTLPVAAALAWAIMVDRRSLTGAIDRTEESVESQWYQRAVVGAFHDLIIILGIGAAGFSLTRITVNTGLLLIGLFIVVAIDVAVRYQVAAREGR